MVESEIIFHYFPNLSTTQKNQFTQLGELYNLWNERINVISRKDIAFFYERHVLHSLGIAKIIEFKKESSVLDVGTGGGFPGVPLAILFPETKFHLVDSIGKKIKVVNEVTSVLAIKNIQTSHLRAEEIKTKYDFIISRAVTEFSTFHSWIKKNIRTESKNEIKNGILYLKGGELEEELMPFKNQVRLFPLSDYYTEEFFETKKVVYLPVN